MEEVKAQRENIVQSKLNFTKSPLMQIVSAKQTNKQIFENENNWPLQKTKTEQQKLNEAIK